MIYIGNGTHRFKCIAKEAKTSYHLNYFGFHKALRIKIQTSLIFPIFIISYSWYK